MDTTEIRGMQFLRCRQEHCQWNIGWLGGHDWTEEPDRGTRICNLGAKAIIEVDAVPPDECHQASAVFELARSEFQF